MKILEKIDEFLNEGKMPDHQKEEIKRLEADMKRWRTNIKYHKEHGGVGTSRANSNAVDEVKRLRKDIKRAKEQIQLIKDQNKNYD